MRPAKTQFSQHIELEITFEQQANYVPPKGLNVYFYDRRNTEKPANRVNATIFCSSINNELNAQKYLHDINAELALLGNYVKKDHLRKSDEPNLIKNPKVRSESILDSSIFSGNRDSVLSRAKARHPIRLNKEQTNGLKLKDAKRQKDGSFQVDFGKITQDE